MPVFVLMKKAAKAWLGVTVVRVNGKMRLYPLITLTGLGMRVIRAGCQKKNRVW